MSTQRSRGWTSIALAVALGGPPLLVLVSRRTIGDSPPVSVQTVLQAVYCAMAGFILWVVRARECLPLESIGVRRPRFATLVWAVGLLAAIQALSLVTTPVARLLGTSGLDEGLRQLRATPLWFRLVLAVTGGIAEEIFYRGYAIERLALIVGRRWLAGVLSAIAFALAHIPYWGVAFSLAADLPFGILMTAFYLWRRDLVANMLAHVGALMFAMAAVV